MLERRFLGRCAQDRPEALSPRALRFQREVFVLHRDRDV
jgi:hypothetical protein